MPRNSPAPRRRYGIGARQRITAGDNQRIELPERSGIACIQLVDAVASNRPHLCRAWVAVKSPLPQSLCLLNQSSDLGRYLCLLRFSRQRPGLVLQIPQSSRIRWLKHFNWSYQDCSLRQTAEGGSVGEGQFCEQINRSNDD